MKISILTVLGILLSAQVLFAQYDNANLLAQSPDGKTVKLLWFIKKWNSNITGFDIKRKEGLKDWQKLNSGAILPEFTRKKKLSIVESDKNEESRIKAKLYDMLSTGNISEIGNKDYIERLNSDDKAVQDIAIMIAHDYDLALINGFAYVDRTVTKKVEYQYGLFIAGTDVLLDSVAWNYGQIPDLNVVREITSNATPGRNGIRIIWSGDAGKMKTGDVAGFNIYREGIRLNTVPIVASNTKDLFEFTWYDKTATSDAPTQYSISAESMFDIEGMIRSYKYDPADHPREYKKAAVTEITSLGYYFKEGIAVKWVFPKDQERFIKGFYVEKDNMPDGYKQVNSIVAPSVRSITDTSTSPVSGYIRFRVVVVYNDQTSLAGTEKLYNYFPMRKPPVPQNVTAKALKEGNKFVVNLYWDPAMNGDSATDFYKLYVSDPVSNKLDAVVENKPLYKNSFTYVIDHGTAYNYKFCVSSVNKNNVESALSDTVFVRIPSVELPVPIITKVFTDGGKAIIQWEYPDIADLKGFKLFQNKNIIAGENEINKNQRVFTTTKLENGSFQFNIQAVAENGVTSELSVPSSATLSN